MHSMTMDISAPLYMDEVIRPNRSLSRRGLWIVLGVLLAFNLAVGALMLMIGAYPVPIFLGLDMLGIVIAFHINTRRALWGERVRVDADRIVVSHEGGPRQREVWASPTAFTRISFEGERERAPRLALHVSGKSTFIAMALGMEDRARFAEALRRAISDARGERHR